LKRRKNASVQSHIGPVRLIALALLVTLCLWAGPVNADFLVVPGTGSCETVLQALAAAFNARSPGGEVQIPASTGSGGGIQAVLNGEAVLARVARPLSEAEVQQGLRHLPFAKDPVVFAVAKNVDVRNLTTAQLIDIFSGNIDDWRQVGGATAPIRVLLREPGDSSLRVIQEHIPAFAGIKFTDRSKALYHVHEMVEMLIKYKHSIGWISHSSLFPVRDSIKALALDNVIPSYQNVKSGRYPLVETEAFIYKQGTLTNLAKRFIIFIFSDAGRNILGQYGLVPINKN
jgi:phosphate transport system substrate-binding protein